MALATYTVKKGDTLTKICNGSLGKNISNSISGNTTKAKINTLVSLNDIKNPDLIYVGQILKLSGTSSSSSTSMAATTPTVTAFGLQAEDTTGRAMYAAWSWSKTKTKCYTVRWLYYADNIWQLGDEHDTEGSGSLYQYSNYSAPSNASKVRFRVKAISKTYGDDDTKYWADTEWSTLKTYDFSNNPPSVPSTPSVEIDDFTLTASIDNIVAADLNAPSVEFNIVKDNSTSIGTYSATINAISNYVSYSHTVEAGFEYKVRARCKRDTVTSGWSEFSSSVGTKPSAPTEITTCKANTYSNSEITVYLEWSEVTNAETYDIEYTTNKNYFDGSNQTSTESGIEFTHYEIGGLSVGVEYFFRVRAVNQNGTSDWSDIASVVLGVTPVAPTTWSSTTKAVVGEDLNLYWVHNAQDGSSQTYAELRLYIDDVLQTPDITIKNSEEEDEKDRTSVYAFDTTSYAEGTQIKWMVRTAGVTKEYGEWSIQRVVDIYAKPTLALSVTTLPDGTGDIITTLTAFPFYIHALAGPSTQTPIGYQLKVMANEYYETIDDTGITKMINKGDAVYSKYFDISNVLIVEMSANNIDLEANIEYTISCTVTMNSGLTAEMSHDFTPDWIDTEYNLDAEIEVHGDTLTASIRPYSIDADGNLVEDLTLSVYRREFDGTFTELGKDIPNTNNVTISDPHPALDYARYRVVGKTVSTGAISFYDLPGHPVGCSSVIIQWDEDWSVFDTSDMYSVERPPWSGSLLKLPYNIDVQDSYGPDVSLVEYIGRKHPVSYYGTQLGATSSWSVEIPKSDTETLYGLRRLAIWSGDVYVREPSGSGYWANIVVSFNQTHLALTIPVSLSISRVEGGV